MSSPKVLFKGWCPVGIKLLVSTLERRQGSSYSTCLVFEWLDCVKVRLPFTLTSAASGWLSSFPLLCGDVVMQLGALARMSVPYCCTFAVARILNQVRNSFVLFFFFLDIKHLNGMEIKSLLLVLSCIGCCSGLGLRLGAGNAIDAPQLDSRSAIM